ncbi:hypothetical protein LTR36_010721 [Oleoguttula mirabilis]|uniref:UmuC domain-containing protein n=1 Tax=Oleoguttula mirabilis TaxID=1507867 RepID=A0AAV9JRB9_9PEZI|nr:hypothetical protein LTR36_010721 [Oleoguttula mirabilis]
MEARMVPSRKDGRVIIHFDYDCFYAAVFEAKNPSLKSLPFAVQQKQIIVTCNYEARRRGLHKLQLIRDARRVCPDVIIELGEDISQFRDASKELYSFIKDYSWSGKVERLGFDEVWVDVTDMVEYNMEMLNRHSLEQSFFQTSRNDPLEGFAFDASSIAGHSYPKDYAQGSVEGDAVIDLTQRLRLGSHIALHIRHQLEQQKGYTCTVGIATSKLLSKLVGSLNKPKGQTTMMPPLSVPEHGGSNVMVFMDGHEVGRVPGVGFKMAQKLREAVLQRPADFDAGLVYGGTKESVTVADVRSHPDVHPEMLEKLLGGPGSPHGLGYKVWCLLHGVDDTEVSQAKAVPSQISIEDSYIRLDTMPELLKELGALARSLITRMRIDLLADDDFDEEREDTDALAARQAPSTVISKKWLAHPKTLRLTTRPRQPLQPDGTRVRSFKRISHSGPLPGLIFNLAESVDSLAEKLVHGSLVGMFRRLHPEKAGWNLSLVNLAVTNMAETAGDSRTAKGRDISNMFRRQDEVLKDFRVTEASSMPDVALGDSDGYADDCVSDGSVYAMAGMGAVDHGGENGDWDEEGEPDDDDERCDYCGARMPGFALVAHRRFHSPVT